MSSMIAKVRARTERQRQKQGKSYPSSIKAAVNGKEMTFNLDEEKNAPLTRLDILEAYLPKNLRQEAQRNRKLRVRGEAKKDVVFNILSGNAGRPYLYTNPQSGGPVSIDSGQTMTVRSYNPAHDPSGAVSAQNSSLTPPDGSELAPVRTYSRGRQPRRTLWSSDIQQSIIEREELIKKELREAEERRSLEISRMLEERQRAEEHELRLKVKVINTLFNKKVKFRDAKMAAIAERILELKEKGIGLSDVLMQKLQDEATELMKKDKLAFSHDINDDNDEGGGDETESGRINDRGGRSIDSSSLDGVKSQSNDYESCAEGDEQQQQQQQHEQQQKQQQKQRKHRRARSTAQKKKRRRDSDEDVLVFRTRDFKGDAKAKGGERVQLQASSKEMRMVSAGLLSSIEAMAISQLRSKLLDLRKYINSHAARKLMDSWNYIEGRVKNSTYMKSFVVQDSKGLVYPAQHAALPLSSLTQMLCSTRVRIGHEELHQLYNSMGFISVEDAYFSRKVAALNVVIQQADENSPQYHHYRQQLLELTLDAIEPLVTLQELRDAAFDEDPEERAKQMEKVIANRQRELDQIVAEKQRRDALKEQAEKRRQRLIFDFEGSLEQLNILDGDGALKPDKLEEFLQMLLRCKKFVAKMLDDKVANIPEDAMSYLGLEVFPLAIQEKVPQCGFFCPLSFVFFVLRLSSI